MKFQVLFLGIFLLFGCSSSPEKQEVTKEGSESVEDTAQNPTWLNDPESLCMPQMELCAVGDGSGSVVAELNARKTLARNLETRIQSSSKILKKSSQLSDADSILDGSTSENIEMEMSELTDQLLKGVTVKKIHRSPNIVHVLVSLDKISSSKILKKEIEAVDDQIKAYYEERSRFGYWKLTKLYNKRQLLDARYQFLRGTSLNPPISFQDIQKIRNENKQKNVVVFLNVEDKSNLKDFKTLITKILTELDYKVVTNRSKPYNFEVDGDFDSEKEFMKIEGFERYKFGINLSSKNDSGEILGAIKFDTIKTGRNFRHAYESATPEILNFLEENFNELKID